MKHASMKWLRARARVFYTDPMKVALGIFRLALAVWLCVGIQVHIALDHPVGMFHFVAHADEPGHSSTVLPITFRPHYECLCCYHTPWPAHHNDGSPHAHMEEALPPPGAKRVLSPAQWLFIARSFDDTPDVRPVAPVYCAPACPRVDSTATPARLRAPPLAGESPLIA